MNQLKEIIKTHQQKIVLVAGYVLVAALAFGLGRLTTFKYSVPDIRVDQAFNLPSNYSPPAADLQPVVPAQSASQKLDCSGKIIGSSGFVYHLPSGAFYKRTTPVRCFTTEAEAQAAGFRKSSR